MSAPWQCRPRATVLPAGKPAGPIQVRGWGPRAAGCLPPCPRALSEPVWHVSLQATQALSACGTALCCTPSTRWSTPSPPSSLPSSSRRTRWCCSTPATPWWPVLSQSTRQVGPWPTKAQHAGSASGPVICRHQSWWQALPSRSCHCLTLQMRVKTPVHGHTAGSGNVSENSATRACAAHQDCPQGRDVLYL